MSTAYGAGPTGLSGTHYGGAGLGVRGGDVSPVGYHAAATLYGLLNLPADADKEFMFRVTEVPPGLTLFRIGEASETEAAGPDGMHLGAYDLYEGGQLTDGNTFRIAFGDVSSQLSGIAALDGVGAGGGVGAGAPSVVSGGAALDGVSAAGGLASGNPSTVGGMATLDGVTAAGVLAGVVGVVSRHVVRTVKQTRRVTSMGTARQVPTMDVAEAAPFEFDFTDEMVADGTTIESFVLMVDVRAGVDPDASALLQGDATRDGHVVRQVVKQHAEPVDYAVRCEALGVNQQRYTAVALVASRRL